MNDWRASAGAPAYRGLLACDLDGTLARPDGAIAGDVREALEALDEQRLPLVVCTGRPLAYARRVVSSGGLRPLAVASFHGGLVTERDSEGIVLHHTLPPDVVQTVATVLLRHRLAATWYLASDRRPLQDAPGDAAATRLLAVGRPTDVDAAWRELLGLTAPMTRVDSPRPGVLDVRHEHRPRSTPCGPSSSIFGVPLANVVACGDDASDEGMLRLAGTAIVVGPPGEAEAEAPHLGVRRVVPQDRFGATLRTLSEVVAGGEAGPWPIT